MPFARTRQATRQAVLAGIAVAASTFASAQQPALPAYSPQPLRAGVIRSMGDAAMRKTMSAWEQAFRKYHPEITFEDNLLGTATSMAGIITNSSDLSLMGRPASVNEIIGFEWVFRVKPLGIQVMNGGLEGEGNSPALAVFVSRSNPLRQITMAQLNAILGCPEHTGQPVTWSLAGADGEWSSKPVHAFLFDDQTGTGAFLQQAILGTGDCWNWDVVKEFKDRRAGDKDETAASQIVQALERDPNGLAVSTLGYAGPSVRALPVALSGEAIPLTPENITSEKYPLRRGVYIYVNRAKDKPLDAKVSEFLRFVLSSEGQSLVAAQGDFLPLNGETALERKEA